MKRGVFMAKSSYLFDKEIQLILNTLTYPNALVVEVMLHTGLRISDVLSLRTEQLAKRFSIVETKTGKKKVVTLPESLLSRLKGQSGTVYVFPSRDDPERHRTRQAVYLDIKKSAKAFRFKANASPHSMRKVYAVDKYNQTGSMESVRRSLNHDHIETTMIYALADHLRAKYGRH